jgi:hypothetical protein
MKIRTKFRIVQKKLENILKLSMEDTKVTVQNYVNNNNNNNKRSGM